MYVTELKMCENLFTKHVILPAIIGIICCEYSIIIYKSFLFILFMATAFAYTCKKFLTQVIFLETASIAVFNYDFVSMQQSFLNYWASNILVVILSLELDTRPQLTVVSPELTLGLKFGPSWIYYPTCPKSWFLETKVRVCLGREIQLLRSHLSGSERVGRGIHQNANVCEGGLKLLS